VQALAVTAIGCIVGTIVRLVIGAVLVKLLSIIFIIPPARAALVTAGSFILVGGAVAGAVFAIAAVAVVVSRSPIASVLREE
jgi:hypothetical protein